MNIIFKGKLPNTEQTYTVNKLSSNHLDDILTLQNIVYESFENKELLQKLSREEFRYILESKGLIIGAFVDGALISVRALLVPPIDKEHLGLAVGLKEDELDKVIYQEISFVHPKYRGNRLQQMLAKLIMEELEKCEHTYQYVCCTVSPFNIPSLKDKFNQNMYIKALNPIYEDKLRYIFIKELHNEKPIWRESIEVPIEHIDIQQQLLNSNRTGYQLIEKNEQYFIKYGRG